MALSKFDSLFFKKYDRKTYNCMHFLVDTWKALFDIDLSFVLPSITLAGAHKNEVSAMHDLMRFRRLREPKTPAVCIMRSVTPEDTHVATFIDGRFLHITEQGVQFIPAEVGILGFPKVLYYEYIDNN